MTALFALASSSIGKIVIAALALVVWTLYQRDDAADKAREECQAATLRQTVTEITRQREAAKRALEMARDQTKQTTVEMTALQRDHDQLKQDYQDAQSACAVPDAATRRMRNIR